MRRTALLVCACLSCAAAGQGAPPDQVVAQSGTLTFTAGDAKRLIDTATPELREQLQHDPALLPKLIRSELLRLVLLDQARAQKWDQKPDVAFRALQAHDTVIVNSYVASLTAPAADYPSDAEIQAAYEANKSRFMAPRQYHLAQIFVAVPSGASSQVEDEARKKARDIRQSLAKPKTDFAATARRQSDDRATAENGGDMGWMREDQLIASVRDAVAGLQESAIGEPVRATDGWHIIQLLGTKPAGPAALADVREQLVRALRQQRTAQNEQGLIDELLRKQPIQLDEIQLQHAMQP
jgi:peptidylprolyl isomerase